VDPISILLAANACVAAIQQRDCELVQARHRVLIHGGQVHCMKKLLVLANEVRALLGKAIRIKAKEPNKPVQQTRKKERVLM
jgi:hypothetical protein